MRDKKHQVLLYNQLATLLEGDVSLPAAIAIIAEEGERNAIQRAIVAVDKRLKEGADLIAAMKEQPAIFPELVVLLVKQDDSEKNLSTLFAGMANDMENRGKHRRRLLLSLLYPGAITFIAICLIFLMLGYVIPVFTGVYEGFGMTLPTLTRVFFTLGVFVKKFWILFLFIVAGCCFFIFFKPKVVLKLCSTLPVFSRLLNTMSLSTFSKTLSILCRFDLSAKEIIAHAAKPVINPSLQHHIQSLADQTTEQQKLSAALGGSNMLPQLLLQMIRVGEHGSSLPKSLNSMAAYYENEAERTSRRLILAVDILAILFVAILVSSFVFAMYSPLFKMATIVG